MIEFESFIYTKQYDDSDEFNKDILNTSKAIIATLPTKPADYNVDLWVSDNMRTIRERFKSAFDALCFHYDHPPDYDMDSFNIINPMDRGDFKSCHTHDQIDAFAVYYSNESEEGGKLRLYDPRFTNRKSFCREPYVEIEPKTGLLIAAPYYIWHEVTPYLGEDTRISLVCNMVFKNVN